MQPIVAPITGSTEGPTLRDLQDGLQILIVQGAMAVGEDLGELDDLLVGERRDGRFGDGTSKLVGLFQQQQSLPVTGEVDKRTAEALNGVLGAFAEATPEWVVRGQVV